MRRLLISAAAFALLGMPVLAQPIGKASVAPEVQQRAQQELQQQRPAAPPPQQDRGQRQQAPQQQAAPQDRGNGGRDYRRDGNRDNNRDYNRDGRDYRRDGRDNYRSGTSGRRNYSGFRDYHRGYNSARRFRGPAYRRPYGWYDRRWTFGEFLPGLFWSTDYWLNDFDRYDLPPPPYGTVWVRNGDDALLIDRDSGEIISVRYGVFY
jgi:Ni/Co efflux regulator RcnB